MTNCLFCRIVAKEIDSKMVYEDENLVMIQDINPQAPVHVLTIPKKHIDRIASITDEDTKAIGNLIYQTKQYAKKNGLEHYRLVFNNGEEAGQAVFHIHLHLLSGRRMTWPPG